MKPIISFLLLAVVGHFLTSCSTSGSSFDSSVRPRDSTALVYVYRSGGILNITLTPGVRIDDVDAEFEDDFKLRNDSHAVIELPVGTHSFSLSGAGIYSKSSNKTLNLKRGDIRFLKVTTRYLGSYERSFSINEVNAQVGKVEAAKTTQVYSNLR